MKKIILFLLLLSGICQAQIVNVPDPGFKSNLILNGVDTNSDGNIQLSEALATTALSIEYLESDYVEDVTGLEAFVNLTSLSMGGWPSIGGTLDVSMMPNLVYLECKNDALTGLNVAGLSNLEELYCAYNWSLTSLDLTGCTALKILDCSDNGMLTLDLSSNPNLETLIANSSTLTGANFNTATSLKTIECSECALTSVDVSALTQLELLKIDNNNITSIQLGSINNLKWLNCSNNQLSTLNVSAQMNLIVLYCGGNLLSTIDVSPLVNLKSFDCSFNSFASLSLWPLPALEELYCTNNMLTSLDLSALQSLKVLYISDNPISAINLAPVTNLTTLTCTNNAITTLDFTGLSQLNYVYFTDTPIIALDFSPCPTIEYVTCGNPVLNTVTTPGPGPRYLNITEAPSMTNLDLSNVSLLDSFSLGINALSTLDFSSCPLANYIGVSGNPNLTYINVKNGNQNMQFSIGGDMSNLAYICANEQNVLSFQELFPDISINSYCSFVPSGDYNTIDGTVLFDADLNGCDASDTLQPLVKIAINDGTTQGAAFLNSDSTYQFYTAAGNFTLAPVLEEPSYFNVASIPAVNFAVANNLTAVRNICITPNGIQPDVEVLIMQNRNARPGFDADYFVIYRNKGNQTVDGSVTVNFDDNRLDYVSAVPAVSAQSLGTITWNYMQLQPFETRTIEFKLNVNSPMETPAVNDGDILDYTATLSYTVPDVSTNTTTATLYQTVVNSLDPNDKTCLEGNVISPSMIGDYVHYNINFENIGTAPAQNIVVKDVIDATKFDINTLQVIYASHPVVTRINGNVVEFIFENINLPGTFDNHGNVVFKIKTKATLVIGNSISNKADIFFDYNFPIETNTATSTFNVLKNKQFTVDATISVYPNPAKNKITVTADSLIKSLQLFDLQGRILQSWIENSKETSIDISGKSNGIYFLKITTEKGSKIGKLIKE